MNFYLEFFTNQLVFWFGSTLAAILYLKSITFLRNRAASNHSDKINTLSKVFSAIVSAWIVCELPLILHSLLKFPFWVAVGCNDRHFFNCQRFFCGKIDLSLRLAEESSRAVKSCYPLLNTALLILLLRPLQAPIRLLLCRPVTNRSQ